MSGQQRATIGVLDSGVGGLSVLREIHNQLPGYPTLYYADQAHLPYGPRGGDEIYRLVEAITHFLSARGAAVIVLACHAASAGALQRLRQAYPDIPFVGIEPAVKPAVAATRTGVVGVLTTQATAEGALYRGVLARFAGDARVITQAAPELVTLVEGNAQQTPEGRALIRRYVEPLRDAGADQIVLACTHFPFLADAIAEVAGAGVTLVDPGPAVARQVGRVLPPDVVPHSAPHRYFTSGDTARFEQMVTLLMGSPAADPTLPD